jgi:hypothetical protein
MTPPSAAGAASSAPEYDVAISFLAKDDPIARAAVRRSNCAMGVGVRADVCQLAMNRAGTGAQRISIRRQKHAQAASAPLPAALMSARPLASVHRLPFHALVR